MSLKQETVSEWQNTKQLFRYRLRTQLPYVYYLLFFQLIGLSIMLFGESISEFELNGGVVHTHTASNATLSLSLLAIGLIAFLLTLKSQRMHLFAFVRTTRTEHYSAFLLLFMLCLIATVTAIATPYFTSSYLYISQSAPIHSELPISFTSIGAFLLSFGTAFAYFILLSAIGYFIGHIIQISRFFIILIFLPFLLIPTFFNNLLVFFMLESNPGVFFLKTLGLSCLLLLGAMLLSNREEVAS